MSNFAGRCIEQFNAESRQAWFGLVAVIGMTLCHILSGQRPYGPVHLMGIGGGLLMTLCFVVGILPGSCCLQICENGIVMRTAFVPAFYSWESIQEIAVRPIGNRPQLTLVLDPSYRKGYVIVFRPTSEVDPEELADELREWRGEYEARTSNARRENADNPG